jgi:saccharopine dehydrogenase-like NADP-dependent oxidoreductase
MRALVLGATGFIGRRVAAELARSDEVEKLTVAGRDRGQVSGLASLLGGPSSGVEAGAFDLTDEAALVSLARDHDVVVSCAGPTHDMEAAGLDAAISSGTTYLSLCNDLDALEGAMARDERARAAGTTVVSGCGLSPGLTNLLAAMGAAELERLDELDIAVAYSLADSYGPATIADVLLSFAGPAPYVSDGRRATARAGEWPKLVYFPEPVGWAETFVSAHPEATTLHRLYPDIRSLLYRSGYTERVAMDAIRGSVALGIATAAPTRGLWHRVLHRSRPLVGMLPPRGSQWTATRVDVRGRMEGRAVTISLGIVDRLVNLAALPLARAALELGTKRAGLPGVHTPDEVFEPAAFLATLGRRGLRMARLAPEVLEPK